MEDIMKRITPLTLILVAMFSAIIFVFTYIGIQVPAFGAFGGLTHLGTLVMYLIAIKYGKFYGMTSAAIGMTLFDLLSLWAAWAPGTFIVRLIAGYIFGLVAESPQGQGASLSKNVMSLLAGGLVIVVGYLVFEALIFNNFITASASIPGNILQIVIASIGLFVIKSMPELPKTMS
jgi:uncharacterized membrane protein